MKEFCAASGPMEGGHRRARTPAGGRGVHRGRDIPGAAPIQRGTRGVANYYDSQPLGMTVSYRILETRRPTEELVLGYVRADFTFPDRATVSLNFGVLVTRGDDGWRILHYQASPAA